MTVIKEIEDFDLDQICRSGQCFRMERRSDGAYALTAFGKYLEAEQRGAEVAFSCTEEEFESVWRAYFDLDADYGSVKRAIDPADAYLQAAARLGGGIRILRQELWEMIVTFIISQRNNIPRIRKCVAAICREFGEKGTDFRGRPYDRFPSSEALASASEEALRGCGLGYRAPYIRKTAQMVCSGQADLKGLSVMAYPQARQELLKLCGVGEKVADCISLFALHYIEAFPVDTHIQDMLKRYPKGFPFERYAGFAGILQQYAFYYELYGTEEQGDGGDKRNSVVLQSRKIRQDPDLKGRAGAHGDTD